ncbi:TMEM164-related integral membrane acyltransferase [Piscibacillus salipiscarius]|uniref:TMEM164-related integral membrane acyltransferase n=1 Tax=Piscibacillus salipiscarius TaxID=299480 RepID=UPI00366D41E9
MSRGEFIPLFGFDHLIYIAGLMLIGFCLFFFRHKIKKKRTLITIIILILSLTQQVLLYGSYAVIMNFDLSESLPLHISRINTILGIIYLITKNEKLFKVLCFFSLYAWTSFLYPSRVYGISHPLGISFFVNHVITLLLPFYAMISYQARVRLNDKYLSFLWFIVYLMVVLMVNPLVDGNYFYLKHKPVFPNLTDWLYIPGTLIVTFILFGLGEKLYLTVQDRLKIPSKE